MKILLKVENLKLKKVRPLCEHVLWNEKEFIDKLKRKYYYLYGFLFDNLDIRMGRQRIDWGTADKLMLVFHI